MSFALTFQSFPSPDGPLHYAWVPWDSDLYGFPFYELKCNDTPPALLAQHLPVWLSGLPAERACLVYAKIAPGAVPLAQVLAQHGFYPVETLMEFHLHLARLNLIIRHQPDQSHLRLADPADLPRIRAIAGSAFAADRFHLDPHLPPEKADQRYSQWIERSFKAQEPIFVLEDTRRGLPEPGQGHIMGFVQCRETAPKTMDISLGAVDKDIQNTGAGVLMYQRLFIECRAQGYREVITRVSLHNIGGIKLTLRLGFTVWSAVTTLHWFRPGGA